MTAQGNYFVDVVNNRAFTSLEFLRDIDKLRLKGMSRREAIAQIVGVKVGYLSPDQQARAVEDLVRETGWMGDGPNDGAIATKEPPKVTLTPRETGL